MNEILHANIFFFIASIAVVCFCVLVSIALYQLIKILQSVRLIISRLEEGSEVLAEDFAQLRSSIVEGSIVSRVINFFYGKMKEVVSPKRKRKISSRNSTSYGSKENNEED